MPEPCFAQHALDSVHLTRRRRDKVTSERKLRSQLLRLRVRQMHDADVDLTTRPIADLERIRRVRLLCLSARLVAHFDGVDDLHLLDAAGLQRARDERGDEPGLHSDRGALVEAVALHPVGDADERRCKFAPRDELPARILNRVRALLAMNVESCENRHAVLPTFGALRVTPLQVEREFTRTLGGQPCSW
jgi:hypothetical protein